MQSSFEVFQSAAAARMQSMPVVAGPLPVPGSEGFLEGVRQRNAFLDWLFYDIKTILPEEAKAISPWLAAEGAILIVPPSGKGTLTLCRSIGEFVRLGAQNVHTLVVAGVGSSALGSAALARNVADAIDAPVAAVVSGYGLADIVAEASGGFLLFGALNSVRHSFEWLDRLRESGVISDPMASDAKLKSTADLSPARRSKDTRTVQALLTHQGVTFDLLVGHSKGNLVLSEALYAIHDSVPESLKRLVKTARIVTISAKIAMPEGFSHIVDVMGQLDNFGALNSRLDIRTDHLVPAAWHHTNTDLCFHLPVTKTMRQVLNLDGIGLFTQGRAGATA